MTEELTEVFALSKLFHERARLGIMTVLTSRRGEIEFNEMLTQLGLTKGNLAVHVSKLEQAGYLEVRKSFAGRIPRTAYAATDLGREVFAAYLVDLERIIALARGGP